MCELSHETVDYGGMKIIVCKDIPYTILYNPEVFRLVTHAQEKGQTLKG